MAKPLLYITGGVLPGPLDSHDQVLVYDVKEDKIADGPHMLTPRAQHACCVVNNILYVTGGENPGAVDAEKFDLKEQKWTSFAADLFQRERHTLVTDGKYLYAFGGRAFGNDKMMYNTLTQYDIANDVWTKLADAPKKLMDHTAVLHDGKTKDKYSYMYVFGGKANKDLLVYDVEKNEWSVIPSIIRSTRCNAQMLYSPSLSKTLLLGGVVNWEGVKDVDTIADGKVESANICHALSFARSHFVVAEAHVADGDDRIVVVGGFDGNFIEAGESFSVQRNSWTVLNTTFNVQKAAGGILLAQ